jgi:hypothetical protein
MAEALLRERRFQARSADSHPADHVHPLAMELLADPLKLSRDEEILGPAFRQSFRTLTIGSAGWWRFRYTNSNGTMLRPLSERFPKTG